MQLRKTVAIFSTNNYQHHYGGYHILLSSVVIHYIHAAIIISSTAPITITNIVHFCPSYCATACMRVTNGEDKTCNSITNHTTTGCERRDSLRNHGNSDLENNMLPCYRK